MSNPTLSYADESASVTISGSTRDDVLYGSLGHNIFRGGEGNDTFHLRHTNDYIVENRSEGSDTAHSSYSYTLPAEVENLVLEGNEAVYGTGNNSDNTLTGNNNRNRLVGGNGNDTLYGNGGVDTLIGGIGDDHLYGDEDRDFLIGQHGDDTLYGDTGNDDLTGGAGNDILVGGEGADLMVGQAGDDVYDVDDAADKVVEEANQGTDTVYSSVSYTAPANVEHVVLTGYDATNATGNNADNTLTGNDNRNRLVGGNGNDTLYGNGGVDTLIGGIGNDKLYGGEARDFLIGQHGDDMLYGDAGNDDLTGGEGNDILVGGEGADLMVGQAGDDVYDVDNAADKVVEEANQGTDTVYSSVSYTAPTNVEHVVLTGSDAINATGNNADNTLTGNDNRNRLVGGNGNDTLYGNGGVDTLIGGIGDDKLYGGEARDFLIGEHGNDLLDGGAGNDDLTGGAGNDTLAGGEGADYVDGGNGNDVLQGGAGNDLYRFGKDYGTDTLAETDGTDTVRFSDGLTAADLDIQTASNANGGTDWIISVKNSTDTLTIDSQTAADGTTAIEQFEIGGQTYNADEFYRLVNGNTEPAGLLAPFGTDTVSAESSALNGNTATVRAAALPATVQDGETVDAALLDNRTSADSLLAGITDAPDTAAAGLEEYAAYSASAVLSPVDADHLAGTANAV
ncbi:calcium-binding protein [Neisseria sp.]|uniref:calcium-binding protein n=1 Tax=Neisseria sp. TaxID=192066 RepID=UPI0035A1B376